MIKQRNLDSSLQNWIMQRGMGAAGFLADGPAGAIGKMYYVNGNGGSDNYDGESPDTPFDTLDKAFDVVNARINWSGTPWATHDVILVYPGTYAENLTNLVYGAKVIGLGFDTRDAQLGAKVKPASGDPVDVGALINSEIHYMGFESPGTGAAFDAAICNNVLLANCFFTGAAEATTAVYAFYTEDTTRLHMLGCQFCNADNGAYFNYADGGDGCNYLLMEGCIISGCSATGIYTHTNLVGPHSIVRDCDIFGGGQTLAIGVDDNAGILELSRLSITATDPVAGCRGANACYGNGSLLGSDGE